MTGLNLLAIALICIGILTLLVTVPLASTRRGDATERRAVVAILLSLTISAVLTTVGVVLVTLRQ